jgi:hypothetical protein
MKMPITTGEATWFGVVTGHWLTQNEFDIWSGNPLMWLYYQSQALKVGWGYLLLALQILALYVWAFTDSFRITSLTTSFTSNALQVYLVYRVIQVDSNWFVCAGLIATIFIGTIAGWRFYRSLLNGRN